MEQVPTVDLADPTSTSLAALDTACRDHGFFLLVGHGLDEVFEATWTWTRRFFDADRSVRTAVMRSEANPLGYYDRELTKRRRDHKEVFDLIDPTVPALDARNRWPEALPGFRSAMVRHFDACSDLAVRTLSFVHDALGLASDERAGSACDRHTSTVRLNHYTLGDPVPADERDGLADLGPTALGHHTDPGVLTLLLQDDTGGLQARTAAGAWIDVAPRPGTVVVNLGDCMQAWSNDRYRAAVHRVLPMTTSRRFSIPYFSNPHRDAIVEPIPALSTDGPRYRPFPWREFMAARAYDNFTDLGTDDTQVTDFRIATP
ncbi:MAG: isopenicillin N synthase family dioxygenase [Actinomycetes bacterium]